MLSDPSFVRSFDGEKLGYIRGGAPAVKRS